MRNRAGLQAGDLRKPEELAAPVPVQIDQYDEVLLMAPERRCLICSGFSMPTPTRS